MNTHTDHITIQLNDLLVGYFKNRTPMPVLGKVNATLHESELVCLVGKNGIGKSTLLRTISGLQPSLEGQIFIDQKPLKSFSAQSLAKKISLVLTDRIYAGNLSVREIVALGRHPYTNWMGNLGKEDRLKIDWALEMTGIRYLEDQLINELSDGQFQKTLIARALAQDSRIIILDEPTAHLDLSNKINILKLLKDLARQTGKSILMATHELELTLQVADFIWMALEKDQMLTGVPEDLVLNGAYTRMTRNEHIYFDKILGKFIIKYNADKFYTVRGEKVRCALTENALTRNGWSAREGADITIEIRKESKNYVWIINAGSTGKKTHSIGEMIQILNKLT